MTPKEKAQELYNKFYSELYPLHSIKPEISKRCALMAADEVLKIDDTIKSLPLTETRIMMEAYPNFWKQVKVEINKL